MRVGICVVLATATAVGLTVPTQADVLFDNFGVGDSYNITTGYTLGDPIGEFNVQGDAFMVGGGDFFLTTIELAVGLAEGQNRLFVDLHSDDGGMPGTLLESAVVEGQMGDFGEFNPPIVATFSASTLLAEGVTYWIIGSTEFNTHAAWNKNDIGDFGLHARQVDFGPWEVTNKARGAFRVNGTLVPAPGTLALLGLAGLCSVRRRRR